MDLRDLDTRTCRSTSRLECRPHDDADTQLEQYFAQIDLLETGVDQVRTVTHTAAVAVTAAVWPGSFALPRLWRSHRLLGHDVWMCSPDVQPRAHLAPSPLLPLAAAYRGKGAGRVLKKARGKVQATGQAMRPRPMTAGCAPFSRHIDVTEHLVHLDFKKVGFEFLSLQRKHPISLGPHQKHKIGLL